MATLALTPVTFTDSLGVTLQAIEEGLPLAALNTLQERAGIGWPAIHAAVIPARTLKHRKAKKQRLSMDESDRLARVARVLDMSVRVFGDLDKARLWMSRPKERFSGRTPLDMLITGAGSLLVEEMLGQIEHGFFA